jgi:hypothetical protein
VDKPGSNKEARSKEQEQRKEKQAGSKKKRKEKGIKKPHTFLYEVL